jgi:CheY-like chemotaxis protein
MGTQQSPLAGAAILVADDHADSADLLQIVLASAGAHVRTAGSAREVLDLLALWQPHAFLLDITLPDMDGTELLSAIRALPGFETTPAIAVTGHAQEHDKERSADAGFALHVVKPFDRKALIEVIGQLLAGRIAPVN